MGPQSPALSSLLFFVTINDYLVLFVLISHAHFHCFLLIFSLLSSKMALLKLAHQPLNLSIFCHGEKHLNLSLHLFITCHLHFLLHPPFLSPPLHLCMCVLNNLNIRETPPVNVLYVLYQHCLTFCFVFLTNEILKKKRKKRRLLRFLIKWITYELVQLVSTKPRAVESLQKIMVPALQFLGQKELVVCLIFF